MMGCTQKKLSKLECIQKDIETTYNNLIWEYVCYEALYWVDHIKWTPSDNQCTV